MRHDPSTYIGIGENGFRAIEPSIPKHDFSASAPFKTKTAARNYGGKIAGFFVFGGVTAMLGYFFFLS